MMVVEIFLDVFVNRSLYIGNEQQPICQIFTKEANHLPGAREKRKTKNLFSINLCIKLVDKVLI